MAAGRSVKGAIKRAVKTLAAAPGRLLRHGGPRSVILTYHSVGRRAHEMNVTPEAFRAQMEWLAANVAVIPFLDAADAAPGVAVTFDDGYRDTLTRAAPILKELGLPATVFVVAGRVGGRLAHDGDDADSALMGWDEIREVEAAGVAVGAHTLTHPRLSGLSVSEQREEIAGCKGLLEDRLGHSVDAFAYPFGSRADYAPRTVDLVREAGFGCAASNRYGANRAEADRFDLRRIWIDRSDSLGMFRAKVKGDLDVLSALDWEAGMFARRMLNRLLRP